MLPLQSIPRKESTMRSATAVSLFVLLAFLPLSVLAGNWRVVPVRVDLDRSTRSSTIRVANSGEQPVRFQISAMEWSQTADGEDRYAETGELLVFPRLATIAAGQDQILRIGLKRPALDNEKAYRVFIEEIPQAKSPEGVGVAVAVRFGVPVFVAPLQTTVKAHLAEVTQQPGGTLAFTIRNEGNVNLRLHRLMLSGLNAAGQPLFSREIKPWYLLAGTRRDYRETLTGEQCRSAARLLVEVETDKTNLRQEIPLRPELCGP